MEFSEKLQELRKQQGLTQEELAEQLFVSRTAISKWESGRGYPSIDSLKAISQYFSVSVDNLLSSDAILTIAEEDKKRQEKRSRTLVFGMLDCSLVLLLVLPFFGEKAKGTVQAVSLLSLATSTSYIKPILLTVIVLLILYGIATLTLQNMEHSVWQRNKEKGSLGLSIVIIFLLIACTQPYAAIFTFAMLVIKALLLVKWT